MRFLITNDDGISSDGILRLARAARKLGQVWVVAPEGERSAAAHSITLRNPIDLYPRDFPVEGVEAWACSGTPGDCVRLGTLNVVPGGADVVLSGINNGYNTASDIQYSATVGAAFEGAFQGILSIALSERDANVCHEVTDAWLPRVLERLTTRLLGPGQIWNVNFPACSLAECRGVLEGRTVSRCIPYRDSYHLVEQLPGGGMRYRVQGIYSEEAEEGTDFRAVVEKYVSIGIVNNVG